MNIGFNNLTLKNIPDDNPIATISIFWVHLTQ